MGPFSGVVLVDTDCVNPEPLRAQCAGMRGGVLFQKAPEILANKPVAPVAFYSAVCGLGSTCIGKRGEAGWALGCGVSSRADNVL